MNDKEIHAIIKMIQYISKVKKYTNDLDYDTFKNDEKTIDATVFSISQIGELVKLLEESTIEKYNGIDWRMIKGLRNRIIHDYEGINLKIVWAIIQHDLSELESQLNEILLDNMN